MEILKKYQEIDQESALIIGVFEEDETICIHKDIDEILSGLIEKKAIKKEIGSIEKIFTFGKIENDIIYIVGLGKKEEYNVTQLEKALRVINRSLVNQITILVDSFVGNLLLSKVVKRIILTVDFYDYVYDECKSKKQENNRLLALYTKENIDAIVEEYFILATAIRNVRDLINKPYNYLNATNLADYAQAMVENYPQVSVEILNKQAIEALEMNAFLSVNKGSKDEPRLIHLYYQGNKESNENIALIGKGVMFDTGGYSLKQTMNTMKDDMGGAATVLGVFEACVKNQLPINVRVVICATDNRIDGGALLPDDVITAMNKKTIEIVSTDAEGRLTLADALTFAQQKGSKELIDIATLTGSVVVALGDYTTGIFGNQKAFVENIIRASQEELEHMWELPITDYIRDKVRGSKVADITNSTGRNMGASGAAAFLEEFVEPNSTWAHIDIAGTVFHTSPSYQEWYGASGVMVKTLYQYLKSRVKN